MAIKFPESVEFPEGAPDNPDGGATLGQVQAIAADIVEDLEPPINLSVLFENALV
jgi:hypothetical protein